MAAALGSVVDARDPVTPARIESLLRLASGDPLLKLALRHRARSAYTDVAGGPLVLPGAGDARKVTQVERDGQRVAVLIHRASLGSVSDGLAAMCALLLEHAELVDELQASRGRIVNAAQQERLRLERNLHDGVQQLLFAIQVKVDAVRERTSDPISGDLREIADDAAAAAEELRSLAHGLYPTILRERGLPDALRAVARTATISVSMGALDVERLPSGVEEAVYFCVCEALQNVSRHAGAGVHASVVVERADDHLTTTVEDDGDGFDVAQGTEGIGLVSMRDRIGAIGGTVEISSTPGVGTRVRAVVPCA